MLTLKHTEQAATKADVAELIDRLCRVEEVPSSRFHATHGAVAAQCALKPSDR